MQTRDTLFMPTEAAVLTGLPLKAVNNAIYAAAYPLRGRPRNQPWRDRKTMRRARRRIDHASAEQLEAITK